MRLNGFRTFPQGYQAMIALQRLVNKSNLDPKLLELIRIRASQINGCAHYLDMHTKDAIAIGENQQRINVLAAWREAPFYSRRERAALAWCEALTEIAETGAPDDVYQSLEDLFSATEIMELTFAIVTINSWNRLAIGMRSEVGPYISNRRQVKL